MTENFPLINNVMHSNRVLQRTKYMKIETTLTKQDYRSFHVFNWFKYRKFHLVILVLWIPNIYSYWNADYESTTEKIWTTILSGIILLLIVIAGMTLLFLLFKLFKRGYQQVLGKHVFELSNDILIEENETTKTETKTEMLKKVFVEKKHVFIMQKNGATHIVPRRSFENQEQENVFVKTLRNQMV
jgi:hypothetical protein